MRAAIQSQNRPQNLPREDRMTASIVCPRCGRASYHPEEVRQGYCGNCHDWTSQPQAEPTQNLDITSPNFGGISPMYDRRAYLPTIPGTQFQFESAYPWSICRICRLLARIYAWKIRERHIRKRHPAPALTYVDPVFQYKRTRPCKTAPNGTGSPCTCDFACVNYWIRADPAFQPPQPLE